MRQGTERHVNLEGNEVIATSRMTMDQLAQIAGVSKITISRALADSPLVRTELRERIKQIARDHGYRLNTAARNLRLRRHHSITAAIEMTPSNDRTMSDPIILAGLGGLLQVMTSAGYRIILTTLGQLLQSSLDDTDGIILLGQGTDADAVAMLSGSGLPLVVWGTPRDGDEPWLTIGSDNREGGQLLGQHLAATGRRRLLFLGDTAHPEVAERLAGLTQAVSGNATEIVQLPCDFSQHMGEQILAQLLRDGWKGDAVVCASDTIALGALAALRTAGIVVPDEVAVTGYDDIPAAANATVALTSVRQEWERAGTALGTTLLAWLDGDKPVPQRLPVQLVTRASTESAARG